MKLAVIPSDPLNVYVKKGISSWLTSYFNPLGYFKEVYCLSPMEDVQRHEFGMHIIPTLPADFAKRCADLSVSICRAYGGYWAAEFALSNRPSSVPIVVSLHDTNPELLFPIVVNADAVFVVSTAVRTAAVKIGVPESRIFCLPNRINLETFSSKSGDPEVDRLRAGFHTKHVLLHVGRKTRQKNPDSVLKALKILGPDYGAVFVGATESAEYKMLAEELDITDRIWFVESIPNELLPYYYSMCDCMCTPSRWEGFGIVFAEALACDAIVVTTDRGPMNEFVVHERNGLLVSNPENISEIADMIWRACNDRDLRVQIKSRARGSVQQFDKRRIDHLEVSYYEETVRRFSIEPIGRGR
jgi:glycosyltransferase involved in cell wall biosynthesis